jgi:hypothetical protein
MLHGPAYIVLGLGVAPVALIRGLLGLLSQMALVALRSWPGSLLGHRRHVLALASNAKAYCNKEK